MSRKFELFGVAAVLGELMMEYEIWKQNKHIGALEVMCKLKKGPFCPYECWTYMDFFNFSMLSITLDG
jgi:hypothetical protein